MQNIQHRPIPARPSRLLFLLSLGWAILTLLPLDTPAQGIKSWDKKTRIGPDAEVGGWYFNLGITGARAKVPDDELTALEIMYVFGRTPASRTLKVGDRILGANGKVFKSEHRFGYGVDKFGYDGPIKDLGNAIEASQGDKRLAGKLTLKIRRNKKTREVILQLGKKYGAFSPTYPFQCEKSERILKENLKWLGSQQKKNGFWSGGRPHIDAFAMLAMLGSGDKKYKKHVQRAAKAMAAQTKAQDESPGHLCWRYTLYGCCLAEYYLKTQEKWVIKELKEIDRWLRMAQAPRGGWGHRQWDEGGKNGYGPICAITAQAQLAWSLMERCGIKIDKKAHQRAHEFIAKGTNKIGYVWYEDSIGGKEYADMGRTGAAAVANFYGINKKKSWRKLALRQARCIGKNWNTFSDTHGSPLLGLVWTALGAAIDGKSLRSLLDNNRWYFALSHCPDGTFVYQPNRDANAQDWTAAPRLSATAATALILTLGKKKLVITGKR